MKRNIASLDGLRAISIFLVILSHASINYYRDYSETFTRWESIIQVLCLLGHLGVTIFFVISGFLITTLLLKEEVINLPRFYFRRTFRIFPPYYFYLLVLLLLTTVGYLDIYPQNFLSAFTYTSNYFASDVRTDDWSIAHSWSLAVEEQFYLTMPFLLYAFGKQKGLRLVALALILCPLVRAIYLWIDPANTHYEFAGFETVADSLAVGCVLAGIRNWLHQKDWYLKIITSNFILILPLFILIITWLIRFQKYTPPILLYIVLFISIQNILIAICIDWAITNEKSLVGKFLNCKPITFIGAASYSIYLWQQIFLNPNTQMHLIFKLILAITVPIFFYYLIEKTSLRLRQYLETRFTNSSV